MHAQLRPAPTALPRLTLTPQQAAALSALSAFALGEHGARMMTLEGYAGTGKALADDQLVQTPAGPRAIGSLRVGDAVFGADGKPVNVVGVFPQGERQAYRVTFRDGASVECDIDHLWAVQTHKQRQIGSAPRILPLGAIVEQGLRFGSGPHKWCIPLCDPVEYPNADLPIDPYLLGLLLGDGTDLGHAPTLCTPDMDRELIDAAIATLPKGMEIREDHAPSCPRYRFVDTTIKGNRLTSALRMLGVDKLSPERAIPPAYLHASVDQRVRLLRGLMDTDGSCVNNRTSFSTKSPDLAAGVADLARSLGGIAVVRREKREGEISVNVKTIQCPFALRRKSSRWSLSKKNPPSRFIVSVEPTRMCLHTCIKVEAKDGLFLTEGYIVTHNTTLVGELLRALGRQMNIAVAAPTNKAVGVLREKIGSGITVDYGSIHSFMGLRLKERDDGRHECVPEGASTIHEYNLVIVDECSMLSRDLFGSLVTTAQHTDTRILFVGDPAQLPPVGDREESPTFRLVQHKAVLTDIVRQAADNPIIAVSMRIREAIEAGRRMSPADIQAAVPPPPADALFTGGGSATAYNWALHDIRQELDTRILAFRNETVLRYNRDIHEAIHGSATPFAVGETVMLNDSHDARDAAGRRIPLFNSEECVVSEIEPGLHPHHNDVPAWRLRLVRDDGSAVICYVVDDRAKLQARIRQMFADAARLKAELLIQRDSAKDAARKAAIGNAWALVNDFANVRHVYAMTIHKSQGSTLHTAIVDLGDVDRMRDDFDFNRALYVATTRAANHLAFVA